MEGWTARKDSSRIPSPPRALGIISVSLETRKRMEVLGRFMGIFKELMVR